VVKPVLEGITVLADDVNGLASFYRDALGLVPVVEEQFYVAFGGEGIRLAIFSRPGMGANTHDHGDYRTPSTGQAFELNLQCAARWRCLRRRRPGARRLDIVFPDCSVSSAASGGPGREAPPQYSRVARCVERGRVGASGHAAIQRDVGPPRGAKGLGEVL